MSNVHPLGQTGKPHQSWSGVSDTGQNDSNCLISYTGKHFGGLSCCFSDFPMNCSFTYLHVSI
ncbi:hypothetical protein MBAV_002546 [Candidatus Magnetobacterium bavaricum]|uniref:Uncharacterized protein n=1 Tax=Candidatus Magnetobacterium bavaricum TaxID=29290 RepID=A0A0F3GTJ2_9BACT|nr:hypothetical protein MBAV_002546 [Candidatus Magnetobacterium bavaricum]